MRPTVHIQTPFHLRRLRATGFGLVGVSFSFTSPDSYSVNKHCHSPIEISLDHFCQISEYDMERSGTMASQAALFSADGLIIVITSGGSGERLQFFFTPTLT